MDRFSNGQSNFDSDHHINIDNEKGRSSISDRGTKSAITTSSATFSPTSSRRSSQLPIPSPRASGFATHPLSSSDRDRYDKDTSHPPNSPLGIMSSIVRRKPNRATLLIGLGAVLLFLVSRGHTGYNPLFGSDDYTLRATDDVASSWHQFPQTVVQAHAPGFTVVDNLYWRNGTFYFLTDAPWHIPSMNYVVHLSVDRKKPTEGRIATRIKTVRLLPLSPEVREENQLGETISAEDAMWEFGSAEVLEGPIILNNDDNFVNHYYHWIGETFLGSWRVWSHWAWKSGMPLPVIKRIAMPNQWSKETAPEGVHPGTIFNDKPGANVWFTEKFFPGVAWDTKAVWNERALTNRYYRMTTVVLASRPGGHDGPSAAFKPWGDVLRLPVAHDWLLSLRKRILKTYKGATPIGMPKKPLVMYLQRQDSSRRLIPDDHEKLLFALGDLERKGIADVVVEQFNSTLGFDEQVARIARATILIAVHGNGLTHTLWMTPTPQSAVFEFQPKTCTITDYSPIAIATGVQHYMVHEDNFCLPLDCPKRHCEVSGGINTEIRLEPHVVIDEIKRRLSSYPAA